MMGVRKVSTPPSSTQGPLEEDPLGELLAQRDARPPRPRLGCCLHPYLYVGEFEDLRSHQRLYFFNLHLDHVGRRARMESARLVMSRIRSLVPAGASHILTGDFNVDQTDESMAY